MTFSRVLRAVPQRTAVLAALWTAFGCYSILDSRFQSAMLQPKAKPWHTLAFGELSYAFLGVLLTPTILFFADRVPMRASSWARTCLTHLGISIVFASVVKLAWDLIYRPPLNFLDGGITWAHVGQSIATGLDWGVLMYWIVVIAAWAYSYRQNLIAETLAMSELRRQFAHAQVDALRMQIHPHFLFNTLHTVTGLLHEDPDAAERMITRLSTFLRESLASARKPIVPLSEELEFVRLYLDIQGVRFEQRLTVDYQIEPIAEQALVPSLILQPIVENCFRYAISRRTSGGKISLRAVVTGTELQLRVTDNGPDAEEVPLDIPGTGLGLANAEARLSALYGPRQRLTFNTLPDGGAEVAIVIPFETMQKNDEAGLASKAVCA